MERKKCSKCREVKPVGLFHKNKTIKGGLQSWCKSCVRENRAGDKLKIRERNKKWLINNKEKLNEYHKKYMARNKIVYISDEVFIKLKEHLCKIKADGTQASIKDFTERAILSAIRAMSMIAK